MLTVPLTEAIMLFLFLYVDTGPHSGVLNGNASPFIALDSSHALYMQMADEVSCQLTPALKKECVLQLSVSL